MTNVRRFAGNPRMTYLPVTIIQGVSYAYDRNINEVYTKAGSVWAGRDMYFTTRSSYIVHGTYQKPFSELAATVTSQCLVERASLSNVHVLIFVLAFSWVYLCILNHADVILVRLGIVVTKLETSDILIDSTCLRRVGFRVLDYPHRINVRVLYATFVSRALYFRIDSQMILLAN